MNPNDKLISEHKKEKRESKDFTPIRFPLIRDPISADDEWRRVKAKVLKTIENERLHGRYFGLHCQLFYNQSK